MKKRPDDDYKSTKIWKIVEKALKDLEKNKDLELTTDIYYPTGYITKQIVEHLKNEDK